MFQSRLPGGDVSLRRVDKAVEVSYVLDGSMTVVLLVMVGAGMAAKVFLSNRPNYWLVAVLVMLIAVLPGVLIGRSFLREQMERLIRSAAEEARSNSPVEA